METPASLAYTAAKERLAGQEASLDNLRARAGSLFAAMSVIVSLLGAAALRSPDALREAGTWIGIIGALTASALIAATILPLVSWEFGMDAGEVRHHSGLNSDSEMTAAAYDKLADELDRYAGRNEPKLERTMWGLILAALAIFVSSVSWLWVLAHA